MSRIGKDYIRDGAHKPSLLRLRWIVLACILPLMVGALAMTIQPSGAPAPKHPAMIDSPPAAHAATTGHTHTVGISRAHNATASTQAASQDTTRKVTEPDWIRIEIHRGDTLSLAFERHGLSYSDSLEIAHLDKYGQHFTRGLRAGDTFKVRANESGHVVALNYPLSRIRTLEIRATDDGYNAHVTHADVTRRKAYAVGTINESFYVDALEAGLSDRVIMNLARIFSWKIDFAHDIRAGDRFIVVYQELYLDGKKVRDGHIMAAQFTNRGEQYRAVRFERAEGKATYYTPDGEALKKAFRRVPLDDHFYISSSFSLAREHPILNTIRVHEGTDFAAPIGTPIHATGEGRITFRGVMSGYGNMVIIDHGRGYTTRYGHMSSFASGQSVGTYVEKGEVIGYVGMTGLATGPHVHYEFRINGTPKNPETVDLPGAPPLPDTLMAEFKQHIKPLLAQINSLEQIKLATNTVSE